MYLTLFITIGSHLVYYNEDTTDDFLGNYRVYAGQSHFGKGLCLIHGLDKLTVL